MNVTTCRGYRSVYSIVWGLVLVLLFTLPDATLAQSTDDVPDSEQARAFDKRQTSPFPLPEISDEVFAVGSGSGLDTGCTFRSGGPLEIGIGIDRYVGEVDSEGFLIDPASLVEAGLLPETLTLTMPAFDIDFNGNISNGAPERDRVFFNGESVNLLAPGNNEFLTGDNNIWIQNSFTIPIEKVKFPGRSNVASPPLNNVRIDIDVANAASGEEFWCMAIDWVALQRLDAWRPVLLVHGILSDGSTWSDWQRWLEDDNVESDAITLTGGLNLGPIRAVGSIQQNATQIGPRVQALKDTYGVDKILIASHSKGGLDSRHYVQGADDVERLLMIGTPNEGSPLATIALGAGAGLVIAFPQSARLALRTLLEAPASYQLTPTYMQRYNRSYAVNSETQYLTVAGSHDPGGFVSGAFYLFGEDDTVVQVSSVHALPYATNETYAASDGSARHTQQTGSQSLYESFGFPALFPGGPSRTSLLAFNEGPMAVESTEPPSALRTWRSSSSSLASKFTPATWQKTPTQPGIATAGSVTTHDVSVDAVSEASFQLIWALGDLDVTVVEPGTGRRIDAAAAASDPDIQFDEPANLPGFQVASITVQDPVPGTWVVEVTGTNVTAGSGTEGYGVTATLVGSSTSFDITTDFDFYRNGNPVQLSARFETGPGSPVTGASTTAQVILPDLTFETVTLLDDGVSGDGAANDGVYGGVFSNTSQAGIYRIIAQGDAPGIGAREDITLVSVSQSQSQFNGSFGNAGRDVDGDGLFDALDVTVGVNADVAGTYRVNAQLTDGAGTVIDAASSVVSLGVGSQSVTLVFSGTKIADSGIDGPYRLERLTLLEVTALDEFLVDQIADAYGTAAYQATDFEGAALLLNGSNSDVGVDTDGNGLFDRLDVSIGVDVRTGGFHQWSARLVDINGTEIDVDGRSGLLNSGSNTISLAFEGESVGANGVDGPYFVRDLLLFSSSTGASLVEANSASTRPYRFSDFEGAPINCPESGLIITDFDSDQPGEPDTGEFVRISNTRSERVSLGGCALVFYDGATNQSYFAIDLIGVVESGDDFLIGNPGVLGRNQTFANNTMQNGPDGLALYQDAAASFPNGRPVVTDNLLSAIVYVDDDKFSRKSGGLQASQVLQSLRDFNETGDLRYDLGANYPNPFSQTTTIQFSVSEPTDVRLTVYDVLGREVARLLDRSVTSGSHNLTWTPSNLASGVYFVRIEAGRFTKTRAVHLVR